MLKAAHTATPEASSEAAPIAHDGAATHPTHQPDMPDEQNPQPHWRQNLRMTGVLLLIWFVVTFVVAYFARSLSFKFFGWPFSFWVGAQGALVVYVLIIGFYAHCMNKLDNACGLSETDEG